MYYIQSILDGLRFLAILSSGSFAISMLVLSDTPGVLDSAIVERGRMIKATHLGSAWPPLATRSCQ